MRAAGALATGQPVPAPDDTRKVSHPGYPNARVVWPSVPRRVCQREIQPREETSWQRARLVAATLFVV